MEFYLKCLVMLCCRVMIAYSTNCPEVCRCFFNLDPQQTVTVDCRGQDLLAIPSPLPNATSHLDVSNNRIQSIGAADIWEGARASIRHLQLQNNAITSIHPDALSSLQELETLILFNNYQLEDLENGTFEGLANLQTLVAYNTGIKKLPAGLFQGLDNIVEIDLSFSQLQCISAGTFNNLTRLKILSLSNNFISSLESGSFVDLPSLHYLSLNHNQLTTVPEMTFSGLDDIRTITLSGNPIDCSCSALYLRQFLLDEGLSGPLCEGPEQFQRRPLLSLAMDEFCALPTASINASDILVIPAGDPLQLTCVTSGTPPPSVSWSREGMALEEGVGGVEIAGSTLTIGSAVSGDSGEYHCSALSSAGLVSSSVLVQVLNSTQPITTEAVVRENVLLDCSSDLPAGLTVRWSFNGSSLADFSSEHAVLQNGSLLLLDVWVEDMGDYICQIGQLQLVRTLNLTALPEIISINQGRCEEPEILRVDSDVFEVLLRCVAVGVPPPTVRWLFRGMVRNTTVPPANLTGGEVEVTYTIFRPLEPDSEGNYTCVAENEAGMVSVTRIVDVRNIIPPMNGVLPTRLTHIVGDTVVIDCPVEGLELQPGYTVMWERSAGFLPLDRIRFVCGNRTLVLEDAVSADVDTYSCMVIEPSGRTFRFNTLLTLFAPPTIDRACATVPMVIALVNETAELMCPSRGSPPVSREWSRDGASLQTGGRIAISFDNGLTLSIAMAQLSDTGLYNCTATIDRSLQSGEIESDTIIFQLTIQSLPVFSTEPANSSVVLGESALLPCTGNGSPTPELSWWRLVEGGDPRRIETNGQVFVTQEGLLILRSSTWDEGFYYCNLTSPAGPPRLSQTIFLDVLIPPFFLGFRPTSTFKEGDMEVTLDCNGLGDPQPSVQWSREPQGIIIPSPGFDNYVQNGSELTIVNVTVADAGIYTCTLTSPAGVASRNTTVFVKAPPVTAVEPEAVRASVGCQVMLRCLDGDGPPQLPFLWTFNTLPLQTTPPRVVVRGDSQLLLSDLQVSDSGNYSCTVIGAVGETTATAILTVEDPVFASGVPSALPTITSPTPSKGFPQPEVTWLKDGDPLPNIRRVTELGEALSVRDVRVTDAGVYQCVATNPLGQDSRSFVVEITSPPFIASHPVPQEVVEGETLTLQCSAGGTPLPSIVWLQDGVEVVSDERHVITSAPSHFQLRVLNVSMEEDSGLYSCLAENVAGRAQHSIQVSILNFTTVPEFEVLPRSVQMREGDVVVLDCQARGVPEPSLSWLQGDQLIPTCPEVALLNLSSPCVPPNMPMMLVILAVSAESEGQYGCLATNVRGIIYHKVTVTLLPPDAALPVFITPPVPAWVRNGSDVTLDCEVGGAPPPQLTWLLNMEPVNLSSPGFEQLSNGSLLIREAEEADVGFFTCLADNGMGSIQATVQVDVIVESGAGGSSAPVITVFPLGTLMLFPGQSAALDCTASGTPSPSITWTRNGRPLDFVAFPSLRLASNGSLLLTQVTGREEGNYSCLATNEQGTSLVPFRLVISSGIFTGNNLDSTTITALSGSNMVLNCRLAGNLTAAMLWEHNGEVARVGGHVTVLNNGSLHISAARVEDGGAYSCLVFTAGGWTRSTLHLNINPRKEPPWFPVMPRPLYAVRKGFVILPCVAESPGGEHTTTSWLHDNRNITRTGSRHRVLQDGSLVLTNLRMSDGGRYSCVGRNEHGQSISRAELTVSRSKVERYLQSRAGSTVLLTCGDGEGDEKAKWSKDGDTIPADRGRVWLHNVSHTHEGEYTCSYGKKQSHNYYLIVQAAPVVTTPPMALSLQAGETAALHCSATGKPPPTLSWHYGGQVLERGGAYSLLANGTLLVYETDSGRNGGVYTCRAENSVGVAELRHLLFIL